MNKNPGGASRVTFWLYSLVCALIFLLVDQLAHRHWMRYGQIDTRSR